MRHLSSLLLVAVGITALTSLSPGEAPARDGMIRVGVYDNRAIAIAFAPSRFNDLSEKRQELEEAKAIGDEARVAELDEWGRELQKRLHRQGFGRALVDDLLVHVEDRLPEVAQSAGVDVITLQCDFASERVVLVDVTDELVQLFDPSPKTLEYVRQIRKQAPLDPDEIERGHEH